MNSDQHKPTQFPEFWDEKWLEIAIDEPYRRNLTLEERASLEILIARNAEGVKAEVRRKKAEESALKEVIESEKQGYVTRALARGLEIELIADITSTSVEFVNSVKAKASDGESKKG